jgi:4-hydroxy-tetrahydrodipicolinate synthase
MIWKMVLAIVLGYAALVGVVYLMQDRLVYFPQMGREIVATPDLHGLAYEDVAIVTEDGETLSAWWLPVPKALGAVLVLHGNAGNISHRLDYALMFGRLGYSTLLLDYRGYGRSSGRPSETGTYRDALAAWRWLTEERGIAAADIVVFGESLGGAVGCWLARRERPRALVLASTFTAVPDLGAEVYPFLPVRWLSRFSYNTLECVPEVHAPVLVMHSPADDIVPYSHGKKLYAAANDPKRFLELGGGHNDGFVHTRPQWVQGLARFLDDVSATTRHDKSTGVPTMSFNEQASGVYVIAATPFHPDGRIDHASADRLTDFYLECGATGITVLGVMGEAPKLDAEESSALVRRVVKRAGRLPVVAGVTSPGFAPMRALARECMEAGAAGVMIAPPHTLRTDDQIVGYYRQGREAIGEDVPFAVQDYPLGFSVVMTPEVLRRIVADNPSCVMLKLEDWPGLEKISALRALEREARMREVSILTGNGGIFLDFEMERGANGAMTGYAFPDMLVEVVRLSAAGKRDEAHDLFDAHLPLMRYEQQPGIGLAVRKYVLKRRGVLASDAQRKPAVSLSETARAEVDYLLARLARSDARAKLP